MRRQDLMAPEVRLKALRGIDPAITGSPRETKPLRGLILPH